MSYNAHFAGSNHYIFETPEGLCCRVPKIFEEYTNCHKILGAKMVTRTPLTEILGDILQNLVARVT